MVMGVKTINSLLRAYEPFLFDITFLVMKQKDDLFYQVEQNDILLSMNCLY